MKKLLRRLFRKDMLVEGELPLFRFYLNEFNAPSRARYPDTIHL